MTAFNKEKELYLKIYDLRWELSATKTHEQERRKELQDQIDQNLKLISELDSETVYYKG